MKMSDKTNELFTAFAEFQGELENATKNAVNPGVKNKYADLAHCINTAKPVLAKHGLAVTQMLGSDESGRQTLITMLTHKSGQFMSSEFVMVEAKLMGGAGSNPAQALGSAITYQRRYAFAAIIGLAQEDDDANSVTKQRQQQKQQPARITDAQINDLASHITNCGYTVQQICQSYNIASLADVPVGEIENVKATVTSWVKK